MFILVKSVQRREAMSGAAMGIMSIGVGPAVEHLPWYGQVAYLIAMGFIGYNLLRLYIEAPKS